METYETPLDPPLGRTPLSPHRVAELLQLCLRSTYFSFNGEFYEQREGAAMGSPVSAVVANLYMEFFEELALRTAPDRPRIWKRYVDDTFTLVKKGELLIHLNSIRPSIKLTTELEEGGSIPFLDTRVTRKVDQARRKDLESGQANAQICSLDDHYPIQLLDDLYHITVSLEKVVRLLPDQPDRFRRPCGW